MSNPLLKVLQSELRSLSVEAQQKKFPAIKEAADRGVRQLRSIQERLEEQSITSDQVVHSIKGSNEEIVKPFLIACESKNTKLIVIALSSLHQILLHNAVPEAGLNIIVETVSRLGHQSSTEESVLLKILQLVLAIFTARGGYEISQATLSKLLKLCYLLNGSKSLNVDMTAKATIRQATSAIFEFLRPKTEENNVNDEKIDEESNSFKNAILYFKDLCSMMEGESGQWLGISGVDNNFTLELLDSIIANYGKLFRNITQFKQMIEQLICPYISNNLSNILSGSSSMTFSHSLRVYKITCSILHSLGTVLPFDSFLMTICHHLKDTIEKPGNNGCNKLLALEVVKTIFYDYDLLLYIHRHISSTINIITSENHIIAKLASSVTLYVQHLLNYNANATPGTPQDLISAERSPSQNNPGISSLSAKLSLDLNQKHTMRLDTLLDKTSYIPTLSESVGVCLECISGLIISLSTMAGIQKLSGVTKRNETEENGDEEHELIENRAICSAFVDIVWAPTLTTLFILLEVCDGDENIQSILRNYLLFTHTCGVTGLSAPRDAFLTNLCKFTPKIKLSKRTYSSSNFSNTSDLFYTIPEVNTNSASSSDSNIIKMDELNRKSVLVMKILFNIAHCLGGLLGSSWYLLLKNFLVIDKLLTQRLPFTSASETEQEDLNILFAALQNLFMSTSHLSDDSLLVMLKALCRLSKDTVNNQLLGDNSKLFAAQKIVETIQVNINRVEKTWQVFSPHILWLIENEDEQVRKFAVSSVSEVIISMYRPEYNKFSSRFGNKDGELETPNIVSPDLERVAFTIFMDIFQSSSDFMDTREYLLNTLNSILQKCGYKFSTAWTVLLPLLKECAAMPTSKKKSAPNSNINRAKLIPFGFKCVQTIGTKDLLPTLGFECLTEFFTVVSAYVKQRDASDLNLSFVAIHLFMSSAEFLTERYPKVKNEDTYQDDKEAGENEGDMSRVDELWLTLYEQLRDSTIDSRPDVRHSALKTLTFVIVSHGNQLTKKTWEKCISDIILKVLDLTHEAATSAETNLEEPELPTAGKDNASSPLDLGVEDPKKKKKQIVVHHSRNTAAKQWSETRSLVIDFLSRVVSEHGNNILSSIPLFVNKACNEITLFIHKSVLSKTSEIAMTAVKNLYDMISSTRGEIKKSLWKGAWEVWHTLADFSKYVTSTEKKESFVNVDTITSLLEGIGKLYDQEKQLKQQRTDDGDLDEFIFTQEDIGKVIDYLIDPFLTCQAAVNVLIFPSHVQRACMELVHKIADFSDQTREHIFKILRNHLPSKEDIRKGQIETPVKFAILLQKVIIEVCCLNAPVTVKRLTFHPIIQLLGDMMQTKFVKQLKNHKSYYLWKSSVKYFEKVIKSCMDETQSNFTIDIDEETWNDVCQAIESFLFHENYLKTNDDDDDDDEAYDSEEDQEEQVDESILLTNLISNFILVNIDSNASSSVKRRFLMILEKATHLTPKPVAKHSMKTLFSFVSKATERLEQVQSKEEDLGKKEKLEVDLGKIVLPILFKRCKSILTQFIQDDKRSGNCPLPKPRRQEVYNTLIELKAIRVNPLLYCELNKLSDSTHQTPALNGYQGLVVRLFPVLCEFISYHGNSEAISTVLLDMFKIVSKELGINEAHVLADE
ncbi:hypothetical protein FDP41_011358 [Naegleria fowleri]|uniref:Protein MON2 homolog n=1 Tax=Naegleria fowleri TaxID=5763 RepID=A0A6A5C9R8_NAEFO|nr:uncharacterized protein FDP41_011358 [Naegleria fowleri]KAF0982428.1 hypothetical protein FDP41_011358 [Naegleria fowleri]